MCQIDWVAIATLLLACVAVWAIFETRKGTKTQIGVQTWIEFVKQFDSPEMQRYRAAEIRPLHSYNPAEHRDIPERVLEWFESVGIAYNRGWLNKELSDEAFSYYVNRWWIIAKTYIEEQRRRRTNLADGLYREFEDMARGMGVKDKNIDSTDIAVFVNEEAERIKYV
jgi:hypothetical protein